MVHITFRALIEVLGKPQEHVEKSLHSYIDHLKKDKNYQVLKVDFAEIKKQKEELWATFAEVEVKTEKMENITAFCFDYMPSLIEILDPRELHFKDIELARFLNDLQAKLHAVDMVAKQVKMENDLIKKNTLGLLKNYLTVLLGKQPLTSAQLSKLTGVEKDRLEDFLDTLLDEGKVSLKGEVYSLVK